VGEKRLTMEKKDLTCASPTVPRIAARSRRLLFARIDFAIAADLLKGVGRSHKILIYILYLFPLVLLYYYSLVAQP